MIQGLGQFKSCPVRSYGCSLKKKGGEMGRKEREHKFAQGCPWTSGSPQERERKSGYEPEELLNLIRRPGGRGGGNPIRQSWPFDPQRPLLAVLMVLPSSWNCTTE